MKGISIRGHKLHEVKMLMVPYNEYSVSYLSYPKNRITFKTNEDEMVLFLPPLLALELFRAKILPLDEDEEFPIHISGKKAGVFKIVDFRYPNSSSGHSVKITLKRQ